MSIASPRASLRRLLWMMAGCMALGIVGLSGCGQRADHSVDESRPARRIVSIVEAGRVVLPRVRSVAVMGEHAFACQILDGMTLVNLADPAAPRVARRFGPNEIQPLEIAVDGTLLFIADRFRGLVVWDAARADGPTSLSALALPGIATGVQLKRDGARRLALVACGSGGLSVVDVSDASRPRLLGSEAKNIDYARSAAGVGSLTLLADNADGGLRVIDLARPEAPVALGAFLMSGFAESVHADDTLVASAWRTGGTRLHAVAGDAASVLRPPVLLATTYRSRNRCHDARVLTAVPDGAAPADRQLMAVADDLNGVDVYDVADPALPLLVGEHHTDGAASALAEYRGHLLVACWDAGLVLLRIDDKGARP